MENINEKTSSELDQYYTRDFVVDLCLETLFNTIKIEKFLLAIEPSAGNGAFSSKIENIIPTIGMDICPKIENVIKKDFLLSNSSDFVTNDIGNYNCDKTIVIGNPPFGKMANLAVKFFNHASNFANTICFILPKTFRKKSIHKKLNLYYHLIEDINLPNNSFVHNDKIHHVPCCFQIWAKKDEKRITNVKYLSSFFCFSKKNNCDFAVRRVGGKAGKAFRDYQMCSENSNYFLKTITEIISTQDLVDLINSINFDKEVTSTAGVKSLTKDELICKISNSKKKCL